MHSSPCNSLKSAAISMWLSQTLPARTRITFRASLADSFGSLPQPPHTSQRLPGLILETPTPRHGWQGGFFSRVSGRLERPLQTSHVAPGRTLDSPVARHGGHFIFSLERLCSAQLFFHPPLLLFGASEGICQSRISASYDKLFAFLAKRSLMDSAVGRDPARSLLILAEAAIEPAVRGMFHYGCR